MALKDVINSAKYGDDIVLTLPDGTTATIGEMRALSAEDRASLTQRQTLVEQAELAVARKVQEFQQAGLLTENGQVVAPVVQPKTDAEVRTYAASELGLDPNDPLLGPVVKEFKTEMAKRDHAIEAMKNDFGSTLKTIVGVVQTAVSANLEERYQNEFERATKGLPTGVKVDYQTAYDFADKHGFKDKWGRLDLNEAIDRMTWEDRKKVERASLKESAQEAIENKARMATAARPRVSGPQSHQPKTDFQPFEKVTTKDGKTREVAKSFDQALAEASNDDALLESAFKTASFGMVQ
jgi:hypothetical protein